MILKLHETYVQLYNATKEKLALQPKGKQFDFNETLIFGKFDQFVKRVGKLLDMFTTIHQFSSLARHNVEGMDTLIQRFLDIMVEFKKKPYDLLVPNPYACPDADSNIVGSGASNARYMSMPPLCGVRY